MEKKIKICTLNCRGLNNVKKILWLKDIVSFNNIDICFLQETHLGSDQSLKILEKNLEYYNVFCHLSKNNARGVAILVRSEFKTLSFSFNEDRYASLDIMLDETVINLINVYVPNLIDEQTIFIEMMDGMIYDKKNIIMGGDFNFVENNKRDRISKEKNVKTKNLNKNQKAWRQFFNIHELSEINFKEEDDKYKMTWSNGSQSSRLDRFYVKNKLNSCMKYSENIKNPMSDHNFIISEFTYKNEKKIKSKRNKNWKLNESILEENKVHLKIIDICNNIAKIKEKENGLWYENFIEKIIKLLKKESRKISKEKTEKINFLFEKFDIFNRNSENGCNELKKIEEEIKEHYKKKAEGIEIRARQAKNNFIKQPSKVLIESERNNRSLIKKFKVGDTILENNDEILDKIYEFYNDLMSKDRADDEKLHNYNFNIKKLDDSFTEYEKQIFLNKKITYDECKKTIENMKISSPGPNGLTIGFFKKYFPYFGHYFVEILNNYNHNLTKTFNEVSVKLLPKNNNSIKSINDLRPISLTNLEYRIFTKILANRFNLVMNDIVREHQTCSMKGRSMFDNITLTRDLIYDSNIRKNTLNIVSVDQRKAFDSISHKYLFKLLEYLNLGEFMFKNIRRLYENSYAKINVNGFETKEIKVNSGIKQGCSLSMILYVLAIEELLIRVNKNEKIKGYQINIIIISQIKVSAYADDVIGYLSDQRSIKEFFCEFGEWGEVSGAQINDEKTKILRLNNVLEYECTSTVDDMKVLGIHFDKSGISHLNLSNAKSNIIKAINIWSNCELNLLQKVVACRTFILSKLWFISIFYFIEDESLKEINGLIFRFIWGNSAELVKRDTLILPTTSGGLNAFHIKSKLKTIVMQQFNYISINYKKPAYNLSVYWLKYKLRGVKLKNYNIIPEGTDEKRPKIYKFMIETFNEYEKINKDYKVGKKYLKSKMVYEQFKKSYEVKPKCEELGINIDWALIYKKLMHKNMNSKLQEINYKVLNNALSLNMRFSSRLGKKCYLCKKQTEDLDHLFINCTISNKLFLFFKETTKKFDFKLNKNSIYYGLGLDFLDNIYISIYKLTIWQTRNLVKKNEQNAEIIFKKLLNYNIILYYKYEKFDSNLKN